MPPIILGPNGKPLSSGPARSTRVIRARYDAAQSTTENARHWAESDALSARAANSPTVRFALRNRSRYEIANNSYAKGIVGTLANDTIGTGPRLQLLTPDDMVNREIEEAFGEWSAEVCLAEKLLTMTKARVSDGEAFLILSTNLGLKGDVKLDIIDMEADQVATPFVNPFDPLAVDGIEFDRYGKPSLYHILRQHPGDYVAYSWEYDSLPADLVIHLFKHDRPKQYRGIPEITPALPLFAYLRRYTLASVSAAEIAANFAAMLQSNMPPGDDTADAEPFETLEINRGMMTTLPAGWAMNQLRAEQPTTTYPQFKAEILNEIARCLNIPYNIAAGNSSGYNYSSGRLDHQTYYKSLRVDQAQIERTVLNHILRAWIAEAQLATDLIPPDINEFPHQWFWDGAEHVDPQKEADAQGTRLTNRTTTYAREFARQGLDWEVQFRQIAAEQALMKELGIAPPSPSGTPAANPNPGQSPPQNDGGDGNVSPEE